MIKRWTGPGNKTEPVALVTGSNPNDASVSEPTSIPDLIRATSAQLSVMTAAIESSPEKIAARLQPAKPVQANRQTFVVYSGSQIENSQLQFIGRTFLVENATNQWWYLSPNDKYIAPYQVAVILPFPDGITMLSIKQQAPAAITQAAENTLESITVTVDSREFLASPGVIGNAAGGGGGGGGGNVDIVSPVDGSGFVEVAVQGTAAVAVQGTVPVSGTFWQAVQPVSGTVGISGSVPVTGTFWQATQPVSGTVGISGTVPVSGTFWQATQPVSVAPPGSVSNGQTSVAVTNTAVQLAAHTLALGLVTVYANAGNSAPVVLGGSGVAASTGVILPAGKALVIGASNTNLLFVNGTAGDGISWIAS